MKQDNCATRALAAETIEVMVNEYNQWFERWANQCANIEGTSIGHTFNEARKGLHSACCGLVRQQMSNFNDPKVREHYAKLQYVECVRQDLKQTPAPKMTGGLPL